MPKFTAPDRAALTSVCGTFRTCQRVRSTGPPEGNGFLRVEFGNAKGPRITSAGRFSPRGPRAWNNPFGSALRCEEGKITGRAIRSWAHHPSIGTARRTVCARRKRPKVRAATLFTSRWPKYGFASPIRPRACGDSQAPAKLMPRLAGIYHLCNPATPTQLTDLSG